MLARLQEDFPLQMPVDDGLDPKGRAELALLAARCFDGTALTAALRAGATPDRAIADVVLEWLQAVDALVDEPPPRAAGWDVGRLEYAADVAAPDFASGTVLRARSYPGGHLDWEAFDVAGSATPELAKGAPTATIATVPVPLRYPGMPASRWWEFEDGAVDWGDVRRRSRGPAALPGRCLRLPVRRRLVGPAGAVAPRLPRAGLLGAGERLVRPHLWSRGHRCRR